MVTYAVFGSSKRISDGDLYKKHIYDLGCVDAAEAVQHISRRKFHTATDHKITQFCLVLSTLTALSITSSESRT